MRLTNIERDAFVRAVLDDVPSIDYKEQARVAIQRKAIGLLPSKLQALYKEFGHWFKTERLWNLPGNIGVVVVVSIDDNDTLHLMKNDSEFWQSIEKLADADDAQADARGELQQKIRAVIYGCTTLKQAHERLPEFAKYLPSLNAPQDRSVPVVANLVADLMAAGWPKDKKRSKTL